MEEAMVRLIGRLLVGGASVALALGMIAGDAGGAGQGVPGRTSTATLVVSAESPGMVRISAVTDQSLGSWSGIGDLRSNGSLCVWSNTGAYEVVATGTGPAGGFELTNGTGARLGFRVEWAGTAGQAQGAALQPGQGARFDTTVRSASCSGGADLNASVIVSIPEADLAAAPAGSYSGTLTLQVAPE
jgi:hypothetical protein